MTQSNDLPSRQRNYAAQAAFRALCEAPLDGSAFDLFTAQYPDIRPEDFDSGNENLEAKYKRRIGREAIYGRSGSGGFVGRLRVLVGQPLQHRVIAFGKEKALRRFEFDPNALTDKTVNAELKSELKRLLPSPCAIYLHRGEINLKIHAHTLQAPNSTKLGANCGVVEDELLRTLAGYLGRHQYWEHGLVDAFVADKAKLPVNTKGNRERMPSDSFFVGCNRPVPLAEIARVLGPCPPKRERYEPGKKPRQERTSKAVNPEFVSPARMPLLQGVTVASAEQISQLHKAWLSQERNGKPFSASLSDLFYMTWLSADETAMLEGFAQLLDFQVADCTGETEAISALIARSHIGDAFTQPQTPAVANLR